MEVCVCYKDGNLIWKDKNMPNWTNDLFEKYLGYVSTWKSE